MAQAGYTPISLYYSTTAAAVPTAGNLASGELAINITDGKLYYKNNSGTVTLLAGSGGGGPAAGSNTQIQFNSSGVFGASSSLTWDGTTLSSTQVNITGQGTLRLQDTTGGEYVGLRSPGTLGASYTLTFPADDGTSGQALITDGSGVLSWSTAASGDVYGPASSTDNAVARFDSTTGKLLQNSVVIVGDTGDVSGVGTLSAATLNLTNALGVAYGGTGQTTLATGALGYGQGTSAHASLSIGTAGQVLTVNSGATAPQWSTLSGVAVTTFSAGTTGFTPSTATAGAVTLAGTLATTNGGTGLTSFTSGGVVYASSTSALATGSALTFNGTNLVTTGSGTLKNLLLTSGTIPSAGNPSISLSSSNNVVYHQSGSGNEITLLDSAQNTMQSVSASRQIWQISNAEIMRLTSTGLGIGTSSPTTKLQVYGTATATQISIDGTGRYKYFEAYASGTRRFYTGWDETSLIATLYTDANYPITFGVNGTEQMRLASAGLGIGTSSPAYKLHVVGSVRLGPAGNDTYIGFGANEDNYFTCGASGIQVFRNSSGAERMRIDSAGNVGIGTSSPTAKVQIGDATVAISNRIVFGKAIASSESYLPAIGQQSSSGVGNDLALAATSTSGVVRFYTGASTNSGEIGTGSNTEKMRLDSAGNLGLGVTPSAWATYKAFDIATQGSIASTGTQMSMLQNAYWSGASFTYKTTNLAALYNQVNGQHQWSTAPSGTAGNPISFTQAMTLDASGNLLVGTTSSGGVGFTAYATGITRINVSGTTLAQYQYSSASVGTITTDGSNIQYNSANGLLFGTGGSTERIRISSGGDILFNGTAVTNAARVEVFYDGSAKNGFVINDTASATSSGYVLFSLNGTSIGTITRVAATSAVVYNTTSDYRLKNVTNAVTGQGARIDALKPVDYQWKENNSQARGFLAHEFQTVYPNSVTGDKDAVDADGNPVYQAMQASTAEVIADLVAELQSLRKRLADAGI